MKKHFFAASAMAFASFSAQAADIVDAAVAAGNFQTLVTALKAAGLVDTLKGSGPFTVFAPTDEAFAKIPKADLDKLLANKARLKSVLTYHVVSGKVISTDIKAGKLKTVQGTDVMIATTGGVTVNKSQDSGRRQRCHPRDRHGGDAQATEANVFRSSLRVEVGHVI